MNEMKITISGGQGNTPPFTAMVTDGEYEGAFGQGQLRDEALGNLFRKLASVLNITIADEV